MLYQNFMQSCKPCTISFSDSILEVKEKEELLKNAHWVIVDKIFISAGIMFNRILGGL